MERVERLERITYRMFQMMLKLYAVEMDLNGFVTALDNAATPADVKGSCRDFLAAYAKSNTDLKSLLVIITNEFADMAGD